MKKVKDVMSRLALLILSILAFIVFFFVLFPVYLFVSYFIIKPINKHLRVVSPEKWNNKVYFKTDKDGNLVLKNKVPYGLLESMVGSVTNAGWYHTHGMSVQVQYFWWTTYNPMVVQKLVEKGVEVIVDEKVVEKVKK